MSDIGAFGEDVEEELVELVLLSQAEYVKNLRVD